MSELTLCHKCNNFDRELLQCGRKNVSHPKKQRLHTCVTFSPLHKHNLKYILGKIRKKLLSNFWDEQWKIPTLKEEKKLKKDFNEYLFYIKLKRNENHE